jgi:hypothetical protein
MVKVYNFLGSWQLFPERSIYKIVQRPLSAIYTIESDVDTHRLRISQSVQHLDQSAIQSSYTVLAESGIQDFDETSVAQQSCVYFVSSTEFNIELFNQGLLTTRILHQLQPNGYLKLIIQSVNGSEIEDMTTEVYHRQLSVLPFASGVSGALVSATEQAVIKNKALMSMEEQTAQQMDQIRKQIELLAIQAQEIQKRKELSHKIYQAQISFQPQIGQTYFLYEKKDESFLLSLIGPKEWGKHLPFKKFESAVQLLADHTWREVY